MTKFKSIGLMGRGVNREVVESLRQLADFLLAQDLEVVLEEKLAPQIPQATFKSCPRKEIGAVCDLIIVVGGDGSLLGAARDLVQHDVPVLGINRGRLGFLTDVLPSEITTKVAAVLTGDYESEQRFLLEATISRDGDIIERADALNDIVVNSGTSGRMISIDLWIDDHMVYRQYSDGLIASTPTGSTAYSLSAGGPILYPTLDAIVLVSICPHTLSNRPIVVSGNSKIKIVICAENTHSLPVTGDGQVRMTAKPGDTVTICKKDQLLTLLHPADHSFYDSCRVKLGWGGHPGH